MSSERKRAYTSAAGVETTPGRASGLELACGARPMRKRQPLEVWRVKYILTAASMWMTPVAKFELEVDVPKRALAGFCWDQRVESTRPARCACRL